MKTWQTLLIQAFKQTPIQSNTQSLCGLFSLHQFIYCALSSAGIENRSPFSLWQLIVIRLQSKGIPDKIRELCIAHITEMHKPVKGFYASALIVGLIAVAISSVFLIIPKTATTFKTLSNGDSILIQVPSPIPDIDSALVGLASTSDYLMPAESINFLISVDLADNTSLYGQKWISNQPDASYSLQLVASSDASQLQKYCHKYRICDQSAIYQTSVKGRKVVRLLYGVFPTLASANQAKTQLPLALQKTRPWARQFKGIKKEL